MTKKIRKPNIPVFITESRNWDFPDVMQNIWKNLNFPVFQYFFGFPGKARTTEEERISREKKLKFGDFFNLEKWEFGTTKLGNSEKPHIPRQRNFSGFRNLQFSR